MLFKELMMMITAIQDSFRAQSSYELEQTLDFSTACHQFKVSMWYSCSFMFIALNCLIYGILTMKTYQFYASLQMLGSR